MRFFCCFRRKRVRVKVKQLKIKPVDLIDYADGGYSIGRQVQSLLVQK